MNIVLNEPLDNLSNQDIDLTGKATPKRFRWIDCNELTAKNRLQILESISIEGINYTAISYVWAGKAHTCIPGCLGSFNVVGATDSDPISIDLLRTASIAASNLGTRYLWLDRVCIMQADKVDKNWQIMNMFSIYKGCEACLVFLGGLQRQVSLQEETDWICRAWTHQEALVPKDVRCVFQWEHGTVETQGVTSGKIEEIEERYSAMMELRYLLQASYVGHLSYRSFTEKIAIFGRARGLITALMGALNLREDDAKENTIWRSALMRTSKRDVDMIFSIMGMFGVQLDAGQYPSQRDATMALAKEILSKGGRANWIVGSFANTVPIPEFPDASNSGHPRHAMIGGKAVNEIDIDWTVSDAPFGRIDEFGTLKITAPMAVVSIAPCLSPKSPFWVGFTSTAFVRINTDGGAFEEEPEVDFIGEPGTHALFAGNIRQFSLPATAARASRKDKLLLLIDRCGSVEVGNRWHKKGMAVVGAELLASFTSCEVEFSYCCRGKV
jgi:hypothetical protein